MTIFVLLLSLSSEASFCFNFFPDIAESKIKKSLTEHGLGQLRTWGPKLSSTLQKLQPIFQSLSQKREQRELTFGAAAPNRRLACLSRKRCLRWVMSQRDEAARLQSQCDARSPLHKEASSMLASEIQERQEVLTTLTVAVSIAIQRSRCTEEGFFNCLDTKFQNSERDARKIYLIGSLTERQ
jgi:hypothetical protein